MREEKHVGTTALGELILSADNQIEIRSYIQNLSKQIRPYFYSFLF